MLRARRGSPARRAARCRWAKARAPGNPRRSEGHSRQAQQPDSQMREILAHAAAGLQNIVDAGVNIGPGFLVIELVAHPGHDSRHISSDVFGLARPRHPEQLLQPFAERDVMARIQKLAIVVDVGFVLGEKSRNITSGQVFRASVSGRSTSIAKRSSSFRCGALTDIECE